MVWEVLRGIDGKRRWGGKDVFWIRVGLVKGNCNVG